MNQMTLTRDLWQAAQRQINKIKPQEARIVQNQRKQPTRSIQTIFRQAQTNIGLFVPKAAVRSTVTASNVPQSVKLLDTYAQRLGYLPMGKIYQKQGSKYLGRIQQMNQKGQKFYKSFPKTDITYFDTPNLVQNFSYRANKTIQKWNDFVTAQTQLADFIDKTRTPQGRKKVIIQYAKGSSKFSNYYKILASLYFMYVQQKSSSLNPLQLHQGDIMRLKEVLTNPNKLQLAYARVSQILGKAKQINPNFFKRIKDFHQYKISSLQASLKKQQYDQIIPLLQQQMATIPPQMIAVPQVKDTQWFQILKKEGLSKNIIEGSLMTTNWDPTQPWFKTMNYLT